MKQDIKKLLGLQSVWVDCWEISDSEVKVAVRSPRTICMCPHCTRSTKKVHSYKIRNIKHSIWQEKTVILVFKQRRFYCRKCGKAFTEYAPGIDRRNTTANFRSILLKNMARASLSYTMENSKVSSSTLYGVLSENHRRHEINWEEQGEKFTLGIDEHSFRGTRMALTLTNITKRKLLKVCEDDRIETVGRFLAGSDKQRINEVCIDMKRGFLLAVQRELPKAIVTVDKFHVIAYANKMVDDVRKVIIGKDFKARRALFKGKERLHEKEKLKLEFLFEKYKNFPALYEAYFVKEKLRDFYESKDMHEAKKNMRNLIMFCENSNSKYITNFGETLKRWKEYILNHFVNGSTSAFTEGVHTKIKMIKRMSFGFRNIQNYIAKISLAFLPFLMINHHTF
jgi:transposase